MIRHGIMAGLGTTILWSVLAVLTLSHLASSGKHSRKWGEKWRETNEVAGESFLGECLWLIAYG